MSLTVEGVADQNGGVTLHSLQLDLVDGWHVVQSKAINEEFEATRHGDFRHAGTRCFVSVAEAK